ncbi:interferon-stimulated 20 kDa exonuclease-like 2 isoform X1 [Numida meleagris]|uniref:interferon-stimulated 20 kDa exonuclease-like 2 isoform X1 n=1 Tax=Numida meleagris TaxID=8996 RepID=UPI000B3E22CA|nr:interferon-stimulated 20 kDa exonuclease-like 2 isoform X1 [Numida meleagris]
MSDLIINVSFGLAAPARRDPAGNRKHRNFVRRRRLERKRALGQKQRPAAPQPGGGLPRKRGCRARGKRRPEAGGGEREEHEENDPPGSSGGTKPSARSTTQETGTKGSQRAKKATKALVRAPGLPPAPSKFVAIDCEMVGTGPGGRNSDLARCSIVDYEGDVLYDRYVRPAEPIVDYRTRWSGIRKQHMANAVPFCKAQREILKILSGKVVIGHAIHNDFKALKYSHPKVLTRDTSKIPLLNQKGGFPEDVSISLKRLAKELLHKDIQVGKSGHSSVEDARTTMELYKVVEAEWEQHLMLNSEQE